MDLWKQQVFQTAVPMVQSFVLCLRHIQRVRHGLLAYICRVPCIYTAIISSIDGTCGYVPCIYDTCSFWSVVFCFSSSQSACPQPSGCGRLRAYAIRTWKGGGYAVTILTLFLICGMIPWYVSLASFGFAPTREISNSRLTVSTSGDVLAPPAESAVCV